jgi:hypothetical protein
MTTEPVIDFDKSEADVDLWTARSNLDLFHQWLDDDDEECLACWALIAPPFDVDVPMVLRGRRNSLCHLLKRERAEYAPKQPLPLGIGRGDALVGVRHAASSSNLALPPCPKVGWPEVEGPSASLRLDVVASHCIPQSEVTIPARSFQQESLTMTLGDVAVVCGDGLVIVGFGLTYVVYRRQRFDSEEREVVSTLALLHAVRDGMSTWGDLHFGGTGYNEETARTRAQLDHDAVIHGSHSQNFRVPTEPITSLIEQSETGWLISGETIAAANVALWKVGIFNQLVQEQTDFNVLHLAEFSDMNIDTSQRHQLAEAAWKLSMSIHQHGIGDASWYRDLMGALDRNIETLEGRRVRKWWSRRA